MRKISLLFVVFALISMTSFGQGFSFKCAKDTTVCSFNSCIDLITKIPNIRTQTTDYQVVSLSATEGCFIPYVESSTPGPSASITTDDTYSGKFPVTFPFSFYGSNYDSLIISGNGFISFDVTKANQFSHWNIINGGTPQNLPSTFYDRAIIMGPYHDLDNRDLSNVSPNRKIKYQVVGTAPHRRLVISYYKVPLFSCNTLFQNTHQIVIYEGVNVVEVFINDMQQCAGWNQGRSMVGMQNYAKNKGIMAPGRRATDPAWGTIGMNESWRFIPKDGPSRFRSVELYDTLGNLMSVGDTASIDPITLKVTFNNICNPSTTAGNDIYIIKTKYQSPINPLEFEYGSDTIRVNKTIPPPLVTSSIPPQLPDTVSLCQNVRDTLKAVGFFNSTYQWYNFANPAGSLPVFVGSPYYPNTSVAGNQTYFVTQKLGCLESDSVMITLQVKAIPTVPTTLQAIPRCGPGLSNIYSTTPLGSDLVFDIYTSSTTPRPLYKDSIIYHPYITGSTTFYIVVRDTLAGCSSSPRVPIIATVNTKPALPTGTNGSRCGPGTILLSANVRPGETINWYNVSGGGNILPGGNSTGIFTTPFIPANSSVNFYIEAKNTSTGCVSDTPRVRIVATTNPTPDLGPDVNQTICNAYTTNLLLLIDTVGYANSSWTFNGVYVATPDNVGEQGVYQLIVENLVYNCPDTANVNLTILPPINPFAGNDTIAATGVDHQLVATCLTPQQGVVRYLWTPSSYLKNPADSIRRTPIVILNNDQMFVVKATNKIGCSATDSVFIKVFPGPDYNTPNAFTPNGDGLNDIFKVVPAGIDNTQYFKIFNRFGELVFQSNRWMRGWDGTKDGKLQPPGTYIWIVKGIDRNGKVVEKKGTVILMQ